MRILHTVPGRNRGGLEQRALDQVAWLAQYGHPVWLATPGNGVTAAKARAQGLPLLPFDFDRPWRLSTLLALRALVRGQGIELIDAHYTRDAKAAMGCLDLCAVVRTRHVDQPLKGNLLRRLQWRRGTDHVIAVAASVRDGLLRSGLADPARTSLIGEWADERFFAGENAGRRARVREELGLAEGQIVILCASMLRLEKGQDHLIRAFAELAKAHPQARLVLAGAPTAESQAYAESLPGLARECGIANGVVFTGFRDDIPDLMEAADVIAIPSVIEAQSRVGAQALARGRPIVASAVGGLVEIVRDGETGLSVPPADPKALAQALGRLIAEPGLAQRLARAGREFAERRLRFDARMAETLAVYEKALAHARSRSYMRVATTQGAAR
ncbi:MAG: glycosyltransferase family 4 protein [Rhodospirillales bacterium]|nr:glycosyltransferase family 4 protein [Rhodospirillales bacterium]